MSVAYFDSSALLSILLEESKAQVAAALWNEHAVKVSSILLNAECWTGMRRHFQRTGQPPPPGWFESRAEFLEGALSKVEIKPVDAVITDSLKKREILSECGTLDAIHLASALYFQEKTDEDFYLVSLDAKMRQTAERLKLKVLPATI